MKLSAKMELPVKIELPVKMEQTHSNAISIWDKNNVEVCCIESPETKLTKQDKDNAKKLVKIINKYWEKES